ncbi:putative cardiolipin synthase YwiE [Shimia sp. SK013]|uniref:cardiolipin synthase n=1 Tax=Shimia sp. SK013 TaxID=1389006 RepID=UPI0006B54212|nr:cardiolipin synthase [Shimia sp. SK013]KPA22607.1 putative cardiolipin synthase YwiE [Shimia sp. SK013]
MTVSISLVFLILLEGLAVLFAFRALSQSRTPQGAVAWVVFLIAAPYIAVFAYLFLGHSKVRGYVTARRDSKELAARIEATRLDFPPKPAAQNADAKFFETIAASPVISGNKFDLLIDGDETFGAIHAAIEAAENYILVQFYIVRDDTSGQALADRLLAARERGVSVRFLYDSVGCSRLTRSYIKRLTDAGVRMLDTNALRGPTKRFQVNFRNHRKTLVVDGDVGFTGGLNVGEEYMGLDEAFGPWRDTHCRIKGPLVQQLQLIFAEDWHWAAQESLIDDLNWVMDVQPADQDGLILAAGPADKMDTGSLYFNGCITAAQERLWIASPYFVPDADIVSALHLAALKGIDVRILLPAKADHWITWLAAFAFFDELRASGVSFYTYEQGFMHQKCVLVDDTIASVGTLNLDNRSCQLNFEQTAILFDTVAARDLEIMFEDDFSRSLKLTTPLHQQPLWVRVLSPVARLFAPVL